MHLIRGKGPSTGWVTFVIVVLALIATPARSSDAPGDALKARLAEVQRLAPANFTVVVEPPFIVVGDEPAERVREHAANTVRWAVDRLKRDFFDRDPDEVIAIWLFRDKASYATHALKLFGDTPSTPYGYYSTQHRALLMNIATGGGTLVHEIVHPFMRANFPACPAWFNEGLGSLFEQSADREGHLRGLTNWRLPGLQQSIREGRTIPFERLLATTDGEFYGAAGGYNQYYGQARYLCYFLQERGLLTKFYREFLSRATSDPTGIATLKAILGTADIPAFQKQWEQFVLELRFR